MKTREHRLSYLKENPEISVLIIGAGINGIGTFRDLAMQGVDVVMVDKGDYCSGASSASSHMVHGGIRYLENGEFRLVREAVQERNRMIENAPHLVKPLKTTFPIFNIFSGLLNAPLKFLGLLDRPSERGAIIMKLGMILYDLFTRSQKTVPGHIFRNKKESLFLYPLLNPDILFTSTYYDGAMPSPERIAIELIQDAVKENEKSIPLNYVCLESSIGKTVTLKDEISGDKIELKPKIVVNAAGPWIDLVNQSMGEKTKLISGTKGSHLIIDHPELSKAIGENEFFFENKDGRIVLIFPLKDKVMIGSSDIRADDPNNLSITEEEIDYFFDMLGRVFPSISINRSNIVFTFSGVRPLQHTENGSTGQISRDHKVQITEPGEEILFPILSLVGGKWTSFRAFSEIATDEILKKLRKTRKMSTENLKIGGGQDYPENEKEKGLIISTWKEKYECSIERAEILFERYGMKADEILQMENYKKDTQLEEYPEFSQEEIQYLIEQEDIVHLDDLVFRRTLLGKLGLITESGLLELAQVAGEILNWGKKKKNTESKLLKTILMKKHHMEFNTYFKNPVHTEEVVIGK
jgi:glycerol-3-phosphate dehydrogenase